MKTSSKLSYYVSKNKPITKIISYYVILALIIVLTSHAVSAANDPGHDTLYVELLGDIITGNLNVSGSIGAGSGTAVGTGVVNASGKVYAEYSEVCTVNNGLCVTPSSAQNGWQVSGNYVYNDSSGVLVGIGTSIPAYKLEINSLDTAMNVSGMLYVNSSSVGVGTINPLHTLSITYSDDNSGTDPDEVKSGLYIRNNDNTAGAYSSVVLEPGDGGDIWAIKTIFNANNDLDFSIGEEDGGGAFNDRLFIENGGNIGIGTTTPAYKLEINSLDKALNVSNNLFVNSTNVGIGTNSPGNAKLNVSGVVDAHDFLINGTPVSTSSGGGNGWSVSGNYVYNDSSGVQVGIGTNTPSAALDVEVSSGGAATIGNSSNTATGDFSIAMTDYANASGSRSIAMGYYTTASGNYSTAMGFGSTASGLSSTAWGVSPTASGEGSIAMGYYTTAIGDYSTAMGAESNASGVGSTAMGGSTAIGVASTAMGTSTAIGDYSTAMGIETIASGEGSTAMGREIEAGGDYVMAIALSDQNGLNVTSSNVMAVMGGKVGIGTTNPNEELTVLGDANISGNVAIAGETAGDGGYELRVGGDSYVTGSAILAASSGSVGIGTSTPVYKLEINSPDKALNVSGNLIVNATALSVSGYAWGLNSMAFLGTAGKLGDLALGAGSYADGTQSVAIGFAASTSGLESVALGSSATAAGIRSLATGFASTATGDYSTTIGREIEVVGNYSLGISLDDSNGLKINPNNIMAVMGGKVGIGTTSPQALLEIDDNNYWGSGRLLVVGIKSIRPAFAIYDDNSGGNNVTVIWQEGQDLRISSTAFTADDWGYDEKTDILTIDGATNNVGIGTTSPDSKLHVSGGDITLDNTKFISFLNSTGGDDGTGIYRAGGNALRIPFNLNSLIFDAKSNRTVLITNSEAVNTFSFNVNGDSYMMGGDVGIGTTTPGEKLHVDGNINVTAGNNVCVEGGACLNEDVAFKVKLDSNQNNIINNVWTTLNMTGVIYDTGSDYSTTTFRFVAPVDGIYHFTGNIAFSNPVADKRYFIALFNGGSVIAQVSYHASLTGAIYGVVSDTMQLSKGDEISLRGNSQSGDNTVDIAGAGAGQAFSYLSGFLVRRT